MRLLGKFTLYNKLVINPLLLHYDSRNVLTLIRLGVPPDDIYVFLRECLTYSRFNIHQQQ